MLQFQEQYFCILFMTTPKAVPAAYRLIIFLRTLIKMFFYSSSAAIDGHWLLMLEADLTL